MGKGIEIQVSKSTDANDKSNAVVDNFEFGPASQIEPMPSGTQFGISDLFALCTMCSLLLAMFIPIFPYFKDNLETAFAIIALQVLVVFGGTIYHAKLRKKAIQNAGAKLGMGYCGEITWKFWPQMRSWLSMSALAGIQIAMALVTSKFPVQAAGFVYYLQLSYFMSRSVLCLWTRVHPGMIEFYENGIVRIATMFFGWAMLEVRPATIYLDRIVVVLKFQESVGFGDFKVVQVSKELREKVFAAKESQRIN